MKSYPECVVASQILRFPGRRKLGGEDALRNALYDAELVRNQNHFKPLQFTRRAIAVELSTMCETLQMIIGDLAEPHAKPGHLIPNRAPTSPEVRS